MEKWKLSDIIYTAIVGVVTLAALLEWLLWIVSFLYCFYKIFRKAEHWTSTLLAVIVGSLFTLLRLIFLPVMIVTLPLPPIITQIWPPFLVVFLQWFAFWSFSLILTVPWLFCIYQLVTKHVGRSRILHKKLRVHATDVSRWPKVVVVMPCFQEEPSVLCAAVDSVVGSEYPTACIHVFLSLDGEQQTTLLQAILTHLGVSPLALPSASTFPTKMDVGFRGARVTISQFPHGGKRSCQRQTYHLIDSMYKEYLKHNDDLFLLFIDSDCVVDRYCIRNFIFDMQLSPGNRHHMLAMTGVITSTTHSHSLLTLLQDLEYVHGQLYERSVESGCGAVTCLPGALTMLRFSAFRRMAKYYFVDSSAQCEDLFDFAKWHLGEDRWLTHLLMIGAKHRYQLQMCTTAFCKTEAVQTFASLLKQRRRWLLGFLANEACMLTDWRLWKRYPLLLLVRFLQNTIRTTSLLFLVMALSLATTTKRIDDLPIGFLAVSLGLNWLMMIYFGLRLRRYKLLLYPVMFIVNPFFNWIYVVYGIVTAGQRTWGGPRADAAAADNKTTVRQAIEQAEACGDDLNIIPESFTAAQGRARDRDGTRTGLIAEGAATTTWHVGDRSGASLENRTVLELPQRGVVQPPGVINGCFSLPPSGSTDSDQDPASYLTSDDDAMTSPVEGATAGGESEEEANGPYAPSKSRSWPRLLLNASRSLLFLPIPSTRLPTPSVDVAALPTRGGPGPEQEDLPLMNAEDRRKYEVANRQRHHDRLDTHALLDEDQPFPPQGAMRFD